ncbi:hypothetical protein K438DRAFT_1765359 [Mycena galopus ATCC 62051]|nr:hypothetical protein K438DRAFT_1765359 [Mycena galopus ATCC 62051]
MIGALGARLTGRYINLDVFKVAHERQPPNATHIQTGKWSAQDSGVDLPCGNVPHEFDTFSCVAQQARVEYMLVLALRLVWDADAGTAITALAHRQSICRPLSKCAGCLSGLGRTNSLGFGLPPILVAATSDNLHLPRGGLTVTPPFVFAAFADSVSLFFMTAFFIKYSSFILKSLFEVDLLAMNTWFEPELLQSSTSGLVAKRVKKFKLSTESSENLQLRTSLAINLDFITKLMRGSGFCYSSILSPNIPSIRNIFSENFQKGKYSRKSKFRSEVQPVRT